MVRVVFQGCWRLEGETFDTIQTLVEQQLECGLPVTKRSEVVLSKAVIREPWELNNDDIVLSHKIGNVRLSSTPRCVIISSVCYWSMKVIKP